MLDIQNLTVQIGEDADAEDPRTILRSFELTIEAGEVHAIMGPNGAGKSTLSYVLTGRDGYEVVSGGITFNGEDLLALSPEERAQRGLFLSFQYPLEIEGVPVMTFLRTALNAQRKARGEEEIAAAPFLKMVKEKAAKLGIEQEMLRRSLNVGFSGGEKKRMEMLQMAVLEPKLLLLDETDSGLDIDALKIFAQTVNAMRDENRAFLIVTHYQRLLQHIEPDFVHIMHDGIIVKTGGPELAAALEAQGYEPVIKSVI